MPKFGVGQAVARTEDPRLLLGEGRYTVDVSLPNEAHAVVLRSPYAHARILSVDTTSASSAPGVLTVLTGPDAKADGIKPIPCLADVTNRDGTPRANVVQDVLAADRVRHVGQPVALVVAQSVAQARDAAELIEVDYDPLPTVTDTVAAVAESAPQVWDEVPRNIGFDWERGDKTAVDAAFSRATRTTMIEVVNNRIVVNSIEPRAAVADFDAESNRTTIYTSSQSTHMHRRVLAAIFGVDEDRIRVITGDVGGGFGMKIFVHPEYPLVMWASQRLRRPVRWVSERTEAFMSDIQGRDNVTRAEMAMDDDGHFLGLRVTTHASLGSHMSMFGPMIPTEAGTSMLAGLYQTPAIYINVIGVMTNTVPTDAYRGAGRPEAIYVIERLVDKAARDLGLAPDEIRRRNFITTDQLPYQTPLDETYDSGEFIELMDSAMERADWQGFAARRQAAANRGKLYGRGMATYVETCGGGGPEQANIKFAQDKDELTVYIGTQTNGQGHETAYKQILSQRLGIDAAAIRIFQGDSDLVPDGLTGGSRSVTNGGMAVDGAGKAVIRKGREIAAHVFEAAADDVEYDDGAFAVAGTDRRLSLFEVARTANDPANLPAGIEPGLDEQYAHTPEASTYPNGCHIVEVEVDPDTGITEIVRYTVVDDFGAVVNPDLLAGQVYGGIVQGIGQALYEHTVYSDEDGQLLSGSFMDYTLPRADNLPFMDFSTRNIPCTKNPMGLKGSGEAGAIGAPPAVMNAVVDALQQRAPAANIQMPATPLAVWQCLHDTPPVV